MARSLPRDRPDEAAGRSSTGGFAFIVQPLRNTIAHELGGNDVGASRGGYDEIKALFWPLLPKHLL